MSQRRRILAPLAVLAVLVALVAAGVSLARRAFLPRPPSLADTLPSRLTDEEFWQLVSDSSEPNGYFRSDNFLSNEVAYQRVIPRLQSSLPSGGVYLGVGPEQNFTYIVALKPKISFIVDIRRGNLDEHLLYKAFIEMSTDRADFLSRLFARPRPAGLTSNAPVGALLDAYERAEPSEELFAHNLQTAKDWLVNRHHFALTADDLNGLEHVYTAFFEGGPELNYSFLAGGFGRGGFFPSYADLMTETDDHGDRRSYLATEENFSVLSAVEKRNGIVPVVGNFAGPKAIRAVGQYLRDHHATVSAFYTSNVEMYLFQQTDDWKMFYGNVAALPLDEHSTFIRSISNRYPRNRLQGGGPRALTELCSMADLVGAFDRGRIDGYYDVIAMSR